MCVSIHRAGACMLLLNSAMKRAKFPRKTCKAYTWKMLCTNENFLKKLLANEQKSITVSSIWNC